MTYTFRGGVHIEEHKNTRKCQVKKLTPPQTVSIPLSQHIGAPCVPVVKAGDKVDKGQLIGRVEAGLGCPVHASVSGTVSKITERYSASGAKIQNIVIENDFEDRISPDLVPSSKPISEYTSDEIVEIVRNAGITGMGGAAFPTYAKLKSAIGKVEYLIVNCAECEPYITADHRLLLEQPETVINGIKILLKALSLRRGIIAVEDNKLDAVSVLDNLLAGSKLIKVSVVRTKYPQGDERQLIFALTGREVPPGKLPADVGCVIFNAETCAAVFNAFAYGMPLTERIVTVAGDCVRKPGNVLVPLGTSFRNLIEFCGGLKRKPDKIIAGGPMMGTAQWDIDAPVTKGTNAVLVFSGRSEAAGQNEKDWVCIGCGRCVEVCPMRLMPVYLAKAAQTGQYDMCGEFGIMGCVECGSCSYICPGSLPIVQYIRIAKDKIKAAKRGGTADGGKK